jgi:hypothetical protein
VLFVIGVLHEAGASVEVTLPQANLFKSGLILLPSFHGASLPSYATILVNQDTLGCVWLWHPVLGALVARDFATMSSRAALFLTA